MGKSLKCPGFRFKPTDVELAMYYLKKKLLGKKLHPEVIAEINLYDFSPWDLPAKSILSGDLEWYFFCSYSKKYSSGSRTNRSTETGYWKGTGKDRDVKYNGRKVAVIKTLIFHVGHAPKGTRTNWVIHEYRMKDEDLANQGVAQEAYVICKVFEKRGAGPQNGAQYGAPFEEEEWDDDDDEDNETSTVTSLGVATPTLLVNLNNASSSTPSTVTSFENERHIDQPSNQDDMLLTHGDAASLLQDNNTQEVEDPKGKKVMTVSLNEDDDGTSEELGPIMSNLDDLGQDAFNMFGIDGFADDDDSLELELDAFVHHYNNRTLCRRRF
ncbi:NAC domain-containing protein 82 [Lactuca sativa]|uniref:NAC domain-containing protein 82 n=1 Tax=Lactuca sativa TaxID=4236 RepID=UPI000CD904B2|nr:NAC domain-containing protein 82 [Lactuca sativa]